MKMAIYMVVIVSESVSSWLESNSVDLAGSHSTNPAGSHSPVPPLSDSDPLLSTSDPIVMGSSGSRAHDFMVTTESLSSLFHCKRGRDRS